MDRAALDPGLATLRHMDSCSVANAIETMNLRLRNEGYTDGSIRRQTNSLSSVVAFAATMRIRSSSPPPDKQPYFEGTDWFDHLLALPQPTILVVEEVTPTALSGAFVGEVHASILSALGCVGVITNGRVRDVTRLDAMGFTAYSSGLTVSHAYTHIIEYGGPVEVASLRVSPGDLLHGDMHGLVSVPPTVVRKLPAVASQLEARERKIVNYCESPAFSVEGLRTLLAD